MLLGISLGLRDGLIDGSFVGDGEGLPLGFEDGDAVGSDDGCGVG